eukprot:Platyproteum_vivax@DN3974_c0_g1_i1.p1
MANHLSDYRYGQVPPSDLSQQLLNHSLMPRLPTSVNSMPSPMPGPMPPMPASLSPMRGALSVAGPISMQGSMQSMAGPGPVTQALLPNILPLDRQGVHPLDVDPSIVPAGVWWREDRKRWEARGGGNRKQNFPVKGYRAMSEAEFFDQKRRELEKACSWRREQMIRTGFKPRQRTARTVLSGSEDPSLMDESSLIKWSRAGDSKKRQHLHHDGSMMHDIINKSLLAAQTPFRLQNPFNLMNGSSRSNQAMEMHTAASNTCAAAMNVVCLYNDIGPEATSFSLWQRDELHIDNATVCSLLHLPATASNQLLFVTPDAARIVCAKDVNKLPAGSFLVVSSLDRQEDDGTGPLASHCAPLNSVGSEGLEAPYSDFDTELHKASEPSSYQYLEANPPPTGRAGRPDWPTGGHNFPDVGHPFSTTGLPAFPDPNPYLPNLSYLITDNMLAPPIPISLHDSRERASLSSLSSMAPTSLASSSMLPMADRLQLHQSAPCPLELSTPLEGQSAGFDDNNDNPSMGGFEHLHSLECMMPSLTAQHCQLLTKQEVDRLMDVQHNSLTKRRKLSADEMLLKRNVEGSTVALEEKQTLDYPQDNTYDDSFQPKEDYQFRYFNYGYDWQKPGCSEAEARQIFEGGLLPNPNHPHSQ